jgi:hypothetical protein
MFVINSVNILLYIFLVKNNNTSCGWLYYNAPIQVFPNLITSIDNLNTTYEIEEYESEFQRKRKYD